MAITVNVSTSLVLLLFVTRGVVADFGPGCPYTLETRAGAGYYTLPVLVGAGVSEGLVLSVRGCGPVYLRLTAGQQDPGPSENYAEIMLDDRLNTSTLANSTGVLDSYTGPLLSCTEFRTFAVAFNFGGVIVSKGKVIRTQSERVLQAFDSADFPGLFANYISVRSEGESHYWNFGQQDGSHGLIVDTRDGVVTSPSYGPGLEYPPNTDCQWVIVTSLPHTSVGLDYIDFGLQDPGSSSNCPDKVTVRHTVQDAPQTVVCGSDTKPSYRSDSDIVHLSFSSDGQTEGRGFVIKFFLAYTDVIYQNGEGFISSPNYPDPYPPYAEIIWYVFLGANYSVTLTFRDFDLDDKAADGSCSADVITVYGGPRSDSSPQLGRFCGQNLPDVVNSGNASIILVKMSSDDVTEGRGFLAHVSIGGCIEVDKYGTNCDQLCPCNVSNTESCDFNDGNCTCKAGWQGNTCDDDIDECVTSPVVTCTEDRECVNTPGTALCQCKARIYTEVDGVCQRRCGGDLTGPEGSFSSPGYEAGGSYPLDVECTWTIRAEAGFRVALTFHSFHLHSQVSASCGPTGDYVSVRPVAGLSNDTRYLCGQLQSPETLESESNLLQVLFSSDVSDSQPGFIASYTVSPECGEELAGEMNGTLSSPDLLGFYPPYSLCTWHISLPYPGFRVALTFTFFDLEEDRTDGKCTYDAVKVETAGNNFSFCGAALPPVVTSDSNSMTVIFRSDSIKNYRGFQASYAANGCIERMFGHFCNVSCACDVNNTVSCDSTNGTCYCKAGWEGVTCEDDVDECNGSLHNCTGGHEECLNTVGGFGCDCQIGYVYDGSGVCQECNEGVFGQHCNTSCNCAMTHTMSCDHVNGTCFCKAGWKGVTCEDDVDEYDGSLHNCTGDQQECVNTIGGFVCVCQPGYVLDNNSVCQECSEGTFGLTCNSSCSCDVMTTESCDHLNGTCYCKAGWEGVRCEDDVDECNRSLHNCTGDHRECANLIGGFQCFCQTGYFLDSKSICQECREGMYGLNCFIACPCDVINTESCDHVNGTCYCKAGWEGVTCEDDVDECNGSLHNCTGDQQECVNTIGGFECYCHTGFLLDNGGVCLECMEGMYGQHCNASCECDVSSTASCDHVNGTCYCKAGWEGVTCDITVVGCNCTGEEEQCVRGVAGVDCACKPGFAYHDRNVCQECPEGQFGQNCSNTCNCNSTNTESCDHVNGTCYCKAGWEGITCDNDVRDCKMNPLSCRGRNEGCVNVTGSFVCRCEDGYFYNTSGLCQDSDECAMSVDNRCSGQCVNTEGAYTCTCDDGYNVDDAGGCHAAPYKLVIGLAVGIPAAIILVGFAIGVAIAAIKRRRTRSAESDKGENPNPPRDGQPGKDSNTGGSTATGYFTRSSSVDSRGMYTGNAARFQAVSSLYKEMYSP